MSHFSVLCLAGAGFNQSGGNWNNLQNQQIGMPFNQQGECNTSSFSWCVPIVLSLLYYNCYTRLVTLKLSFISAIAIIIFVNFKVALEIGLQFTQLFVWFGRSISFFHCEGVGYGALFCAGEETTLKAATVHWLSYCMIIFLQVIIWWAEVGLTNNSITKAIIRTLGEGTESMQVSSSQSFIPMLSVLLQLSVVSTY